MAIDRELTKMGHKEEKYAKKKKGDLGSLPTVTKKSDKSADEVTDKTSDDDNDNKNKDEL